MYTKRALQRNPKNTYVGHFKLIYEAEIINSDKANLFLTGKVGLIVSGGWRKEEV